MINGGIMADTTVSTMDISKLKVPDLKRELKIRGLSTTGNKNELLERLQLALKNNDATSGDADDFEEDLLNDDEDEHLDGNESVITEIDNVLDESPLSKPKSLKRKSIESQSSEAKAGGPIKKVILNRNNSVTEERDVTKPALNEKQNTEDGSNESEAKKVIKLSELTAKERLEMRAKKFGVALSTDAKKVARAERFGVASTNSSSANSIKSSNVDTSVEVLKKRAERFGGSVSKTMTSLENKEKLEARKARFTGSAATNTGSSTNGSSSTTASNDDKLKMRLERFKQPVK